jgi:hypothetical protein
VDASSRPRNHVMFSCQNIQECHYISMPILHSEFTSSIFHLTIYRSLPKMDLIELKSSFCFYHEKILPQREFHTNEMYMNKNNIFKMSKHIRCTLI